MTRVGKIPKLAGDMICIRIWILGNEEDMIYIRIRIFIRIHILDIRIVMGFCRIHQFPKPTHLFTSIYNLRYELFVPMYRGPFRCRRQRALRVLSWPPFALWSAAAWRMHHDVCSLNDAPNCSSALQLFRVCIRSVYIFSDRRQPQRSGALERVSRRPTVARCCTVRRVSLRKNLLSDVHLCFTCCHRVAAAGGWRIRLTGPSVRMLTTPLTSTRFDTSSIAYSSIFDHCLYEIDLQFWKKMARIWNRCGCNETQNALCANDALFISM